MQTEKTGNEKPLNTSSNKINTKLSSMDANEIKNYKHN